MDFFCANEDETLALGQRLGRALIDLRANQSLTTALTIGLDGDLGAGKTCFVRGVAQGICVPPSIYVSSPTFTLINEYRGAGIGEGVNLAHWDLYRLDPDEDLMELGLDDYLHGQWVNLVEWFSRMPHAFGQQRLEIHIATLPDAMRHFRVNAIGQQSDVVASTWKRAL